MFHPWECVKEETLLKTMQEVDIFQTKIAERVVIGIPCVQVSYYMYLVPTGVKHILRLGQPEMAEIHIIVT